MPIKLNNSKFDDPDVLTYIVCADQNIWKTQIIIR